MFELQDSRVVAILEKMISSDQLHANVDTSENIVIVDRASQSSRLQFLVNQYVDKLSYVIDNHEKLYDSKLALDEKQKRSKKR
jgi:translation initiation factor 3 subunit C